MFLAKGGVENYMGLPQLAHTQVGIAISGPGPAVDSAGHSGLVSIRLPQALLLQAAQSRWHIRYSLQLSQ